MVPDSIAVPQFRAEPTAEDSAPATFTADHSDEAMRLLRDPFEPRATHGAGLEHADAGSVF